MLGCLAGIALLSLSFGLLGTPGGWLLFLLQKETGRAPALWGGRTWDGSRGGHTGVPFLCACRAEQGEAEGIEVGRGTDPTWDQHHVAIGSPREQGRSLLFFCCLIYYWEWERSGELKHILQSEACVHVFNYTVTFRNA